MLVQREDICFARRKSGFDSPALHSAQSTWLGRQLADHFGLEPEMLWVRVPLELLGSLKGEVRSLKFHTSPFLLQTSKVLVEQRSARLPGIVTQEPSRFLSVQIRSGTLNVVFRSAKATLLNATFAERKATIGVVRKPEKRRSSNLRDMSVGSIPLRSTQFSEGSRIRLAGPVC